MIKNEMIRRAVVVAMCAAALWSFAEAFLPGGELVGREEFL